MLVSQKIKKAIESEIKAQKNLLKMLETQESNYGVDLTSQKEEINQSIKYYSKIMEEK